MSAKSLNRPKSGISAFTSRRDRSPDGMRFMSKFEAKNSADIKSHRPETAPFYSSRKGSKLRP